MKLLLAGLLSFGSLLLAQTASSGDAATGYTFKAYRLGMTLDEFRALTPHVSATAYQSDPRNMFKMKKIQVTLPVCTDEYQGVISIMDPLGAPAPGVIVCETAVHGENKESEMVAGIQPVEIEYQFFRGKLFQIYFRFKALYFPVVLAAFQDKYGPATSTDSEAFQNGFGAKWTGSIVRWKRDSQAIMLQEGPKNGPGQSQDPLGLEGSTVHIVDGPALQELVKSNPPKAPKRDF